MCCAMTTVSLCFLAAVCQKTVLQTDLIIIIYGYLIHWAELPKLVV